MHNYKKSVKFTLILVYVAIFLLFAMVVALPWIVTWYVEVRGKDAGLPAVIMLTCYPCVPPVAIALFALKSMLKNILNGLIFGDENIRSLNKIAVSSLICGVITAVAGYFYLPFYFVSLAAFGCAIIIKAIKDTFAAQLENQREKLYESVREEL